MITNLGELIQGLNNVWLSKPLKSREDTTIRVYLNGMYKVESIELSQEDGAIVLWIDERGEEYS
jgi:hypothetical protein